MGLKHLLFVNIVPLLFSILIRITLGGESLSGMWQYGAWVELEKLFFFNIVWELRGTRPFSRSRVHLAHCGANS
jgi:hypothetical protein